MELLRNTTILMIVIITGTILKISSVDVDKSGKHPKYMLFVKLKVESTGNTDSGINIDSVVTLQAKEADFIKQLGRIPQVGDCVVVTTDVSGKHPKIITLGKISFSTGENE